MEVEQCSRKTKICDAAGCVTDNLTPQRKKQRQNSVVACTQFFFTHQLDLAVLTYILSLVQDARDLQSFLRYLMRHEMRIPLPSAPGSNNYMRLQLATVEIRCPVQRQYLTVFSERLKSVGDGTLWRRLFDRRYDRILQQLQSQRFGGFINMPRNYEWIESIVHDPFLELFAFLHADTDKLDDYHHLKVM